MASKKTTAAQNEAPGVEPTESPAGMAPDPFAGFSIPNDSGPPQLSDLVAVTAEKVAEWKERGINPYPHRAIIFKHVNGSAERLEGAWPVVDVTRDWIRDKWGAGTYTIQVHNADSQILTRRGCSVTGVNGSTAAAPPASAVLGGVDLGGSNADLTKFLLLKLLERQEPKQDPMREVVASMASLMQVQLAGLAAAKPSGEDPAIKILLAILPKLLEKPAAPIVPAAPRTTSEEFLTLMRFGMALASKQNSSGSPAAEKEDSEVMKMIPELADSLGPGLIGTIAAAVLPKEKADAVLNIIEQHMKTRQTEAEAQAKTAPIDTEGVPMP